jgi:hypothetical protein
MNFWKRLSLIASGVLVVLWLVSVAAGSGAAPAPGAARNACVVNCL